MNIKEIKASKAQGHKRTEDAKNNRKANKETKKGAFKAIYWWSLAGWAKGAPGLQSLPVSLDQVSVSSFSSSSLSSFLPFSLNKMSTVPHCCCDYTLPLLVRTPPPPEPLRPSPFMGLPASPPTKLCLPLALSLGVCVPFSWWTAWRFQWLQSKVQGLISNRSHQSLRFQLTGGRCLHCVLKRHCLFTRKK